MVQLSPGDTMIFMALSIIGCVFLMRIFWRILMGNIQLMKAIKANNKEFKRRMKEKEDMQAKGDRHEWVTIPYGTKEVMVCKKTGWSPTINAFLSMEYIKMWLDKQKQEEEYQKYREEKMLLLSEKHGINIEKLEEIAEGIFKIKKDFHLKKMEESIQEMKKIFEDKNGEKNV